MRGPVMIRRLGIVCALLAIALLAPGCTRKKHRSNDGGGVGPGIPRITQISPGNGSVLGGYTVTITTADFQDDFTADVPLVYFDGDPAVIGAVDSSTVVAVVPPHSMAEAVDVDLFGTGTPESARKPFGFTYTDVDGCSLFSISPPWSMLPGRDVVITGYFIPGPLALIEVSFGPNQGTVINADATTIIVTAPPGLVGPVDVTVNDAGGNSCTCVGCFQYNDDGCVIASIVSNVGGTNGGTTVRIDGWDYDTQSLEVRFGGILVDPSTIDVVDSTTITCLSPASATEGVKDVEVRGLLNGLNCIIPGAFQYQSPGGGACIVSGISPDSGPATGGLRVTITGSGFDRNTGVLFGRRPATWVNYIDSSTIDAFTPSYGGELGPTPREVDVVVAPEFRDPFTVAGGYTYN